MQTVTPGASHLEVTPIAYGTWQFGGDWEPVDEQAAVAGLVREGLTRHMGVSNYSTDQITGLGFRRNLEVVAAPGRSAADRGATTAQLAVAWALAHPAVQVAIAGSRTPAHLEESLEAPDLTLSQGDLAEIDSIMAPRYRSAAPFRKV